MSKYKQFIFDSYDFDINSKTLTLNYALDDAIHFTERYQFDFTFSDFDNQVLDRACQLLFFLAGVSYYKTYLPEEIEVRSGEVDKHLASFLSKTYQKGLGEFFYVNKLDPQTPVTFPVNTEPIAPITSKHHDGLLIGIGGGKDSLVTVELLRNQPKAATWSLNHRKQLEPLIKRIGLPHFYVEREWDTQLLELNKQDALNGHVPISAIIASVGTIVGVLTGYMNHIVSNEASANEPTLTYRDVSINHQYSKSMEFEQDFQAVLGQMCIEGPWYGSFLRPLSELYIAKLFGERYFDTYHDVFSSCNRAFTHDSPGLYWDASCAKCAFVFLALTPFVERERLELLFGKNLLTDPSLDSTYRQLLGIEGDKPLDCVGEIKESRAAMRMAQTIYPELIDKFVFEIPENYDYLTLSQDKLTDALRSLLETQL